MTTYSARIRRDYRNNNTPAERLSFEPFNTTAASRPVGKTNLTREFVYAKLATFRRHDLPELFARWRHDHNDPSVPDEVRDELRHLKHADVITLQVQDESEPELDDSFSGLGIAS